MYYNESLKDVYLRLNSSELGLSDAEAKERLKLEGFNEIGSDTGTNIFKILLNQFKNFLLLLLIFAAILSLSLGEIPDFFGIITIVILTVILGFIQEYRAEKAMNSLRKISAPYAKVIRDGKEKKILARELVYGDIILLEEGDIIPADLRLIETSSFRVDESSLTGESTPVHKNAEQLNGELVVNDQTNMAFMGTIVNFGKAKGIVVATGMRTEFGKIAGSIQEIAEQSTPLQMKFEKMAKQLSGAVLFLVGLVFVFGIFSLKIGIVELFLFSLSLAVAAVPSSLPAIVTISLGLGAKRLAGKNMIIKRLPAAESLGSVTVICSDKTGTITKNQMTVTKIYFGQKIIDVTGSGYSPKGEFFYSGKKLTDKELGSLEVLFRVGYLCNNAKLVSTEGKWSIIGDSTEGSLIVLAKKSLSEKYFEENFNKKDELPFDSDRKLMSVIYENLKKKKTEAYIKGAPDMLLDACDRILINGKIRKINKRDKDIILQQNNMFAEQSLRVLGLAYRDLPKLKKYDISNVEHHLIFIGLVGMMDPPRDNVDQAIKQCTEAGIKVVMITGDHPTTAKAISRQIGLLQDGDIVLTGAELEKMSDAELDDQIENIRIIARAMPIQKTRIVAALQKKGHVVAMTGDGVNDAPALKKADVGIAMGITGTDVSKEVAKTILVDDNFNTIVNAISEGRNIYDKIIKSTKYLLACNVGEIVSVFLAIILRFPLPLVPLQILLMNLLTDGIPALGLGSENPEDDVMKRPPRDPKENPINREMLMLILFFGFAMGLGTLFVFAIYQDKGLSYAQTMAFTTLVMFEMFAVMSARSFAGFKKINPFSNKWLSLGIFTSISLQFAVIYIGPLQKVFGTVPITWMDWLIILGVSCFGFIFMEMSKFFVKEHF
ncbi:TPA: cation-translocating P-type ATPase, partial [bacterium]|nr:cation-translocating P-type ATPase [bacterium]